jgi:protein-S-isoprenylcysteine O-methyltransferase Ste14
MKQKHFIDIHKGATLFIVMLMMWYYQQFENFTAWIYFAIHGSYGMMWVGKSFIFPDKTWEAHCSIWYGFYMWFGLTLYWISPYIIMSQSISNSPIYLGLIVLLFIIGSFLHFSADMQKFIQLQTSPNKLISNGLMSYCRNINYFGELLIYLSFALMAKHWIPFLVLLLFIIIIWLPNMFKKDRSLSKYPEFEDYKKRSYFFIPLVW